MKTTLMACLAVLMAAAVQAEDLRLPRIFADHMVLQRERPLCIWGWAGAGAEVTVDFAGRSARTKAAADGRWRVNLPALPASATGCDLVVRAGAQILTIQDCLVGEVWFSAGQSNMMMSLASATGGAEGLKRLEACPLLRVADLPGQSLKADEPLSDLAQPVPWNRPTSGYSAVSGFFAEKLYRHLGGQVPVGMITATAIVPAEAWVDAPALAASPALAGLLKSPLGMTAKWYNGIIAPLGPYALRGVLYYQAEYNGGRDGEFQILFPALIAAWRGAFAQPELPFLFVQLPGFIEQRAAKDQRLDMDAATLTALRQPEPFGTWTGMREAQKTVWRQVPHTGMAVSIDVGDPYDIHPKQKEPIADRLLLAARQVAYGEKVESVGPVPASIALDGARFIITYDHLGGGLVAKGGRLDGFDIAGADLVLRPAQARIEAGGRIAVWHPEVTHPTMLHYAWGSCPPCTLYSTEGLPALPFQHRLRDRIHPADSASFPFRNGSFEQGQEGVADGWTLVGGALRSRSRSSPAAWAVLLPAHGSAASQDRIAQGLGYAWNCDPLQPLAVRPGCVAAYSFALAVEGGKPLTVYMRLCQDPTAGGYQFWGGVPEVRSASSAFALRQIATAFLPVFDISADTAGAFFANLNKDGGTIRLDDFSPVTLLRPLLALDDAGPIVLPSTKPGGSATSVPRRIRNGQVRSAPRQLDEQPAQPVPTVLYGLAGQARSEPAHMQRLTLPGDEVGAVLIGKQAGLFEFISEHRGATPQTLRLVGGDGKGGLSGGPTPESETLALRFTGADQPGTYVATVRIVTQAMNLGVLSAGLPGEPPKGLYYLDLPVTAQVAR